MTEFAAGVATVCAIVLVVVGTIALVCAIGRALWGMFK